MNGPNAFSRGPHTFAIGDRVYVDRSRPRKRDNYVATIGRLYRDAQGAVVAVEVRNERFRTVVPDRIKPLSAAPSHLRQSKKA